jgi:glycosyltransferase involved in cell wall biosynthesis
MRIAFVSTMGGSKWGGSEELWSLAAEELLTKGHQVYMSIYTGVSSGRLLALQKGGAIIHRRKLAEQSASLHIKIFHKAKEMLAQRLGWNYAALIAFKPDVLCINLAGSYDILYSPELRALTNKLGIPYTIICQGHDDIPFATEQFRQTVKAIFVKANWVAFVSQANLQSTQRHLAIKLPNGFVVNNPANLISIDCVSYPQDTPTLKFVIVSRLDARQKGHDILFEALSKPQWKTRNWSLTLAGSGIHHQYLMELVRLNGIEDKVLFAGQVNDIRLLWKEHHLLLLPSRYEGTPLALIEAMLCGRTAVATDVAGNTEWIDSDIGFIAEAPSVRYIEKALERMWTQKDQLEEMGKKCHIKASTLFNPDIHKLIAEKLTKD